VVSTDLPSQYVRTELDAEGITWLTAAEGVTLHAEASLAVSYDELESEPEWGREIVTSQLTNLGIALRGHFHVGADNWGTKGNNRHLAGSHRSQEWIRGSAYCTNRTYTVQSGLNSTQLRYIGAFDLQPTESWGSSANRAAMITITRRMIDAMQAGRLNGVRQVFGTLNGSTVTGWDNVTNRVITADSSHLDHLHAGLDRARMADDDLMTDIFSTLTGEEMALSPEDIRAVADAVWSRDVDPAAGTTQAAYRALDAAQKAAEAALRAVNEVKVMLAAMNTGDASGTYSVSGQLQMNRTSAAADVAAAPES